MKTINDINAEQYKRVEIMAELIGGIWKCKKCHSHIQQTTGYASVHDGPFPGSGSGRVLHYPIPYCPTCEEKPTGAAISDTVDCDD